MFLYCYFELQLRPHLGLYLGDINRKEKKGMEWNGKKKIVKKRIVKKRREEKRRENEWINK